MNKMFTRQTPTKQVKKRKMNVFTIEKADKDTDNEMSLYSVLRVPLLFLKLCGMRDTVRPSTTDVRANVQLCTRLRDVAIVLSTTAIYVFLYYVDMAESRIINEYTIAFGLCSRLTQILTYEFIFLRVIRDGREEAAIIKQMAKIDHLLNIYRNPRFYSPWLGVKAATIPYLGIFLDHVIIWYSLTFRSFFLKLPWFLIAVAITSEQILCGCFLAAISQRIDALVEALEQSTDRNLTNGLHREDLPLDCAREVIERAGSVIHNIKIAFRKQVIMFTTHSFFIGLLYEEKVLLNFSSNVWTDYCRVILVYSKTLAVLLMLCWAAERLNHGREKLCAALQRKTHSATTIENRQKAKDLHRLISSCQPEVLHLYGFMSIRMQLIPTILGFFATYSVVIVQLGQGAFNSP